MIDVDEAAAELRIDPDLWCQVEFLHYDAGARRGVLQMPAGQCCDMRACIALFERIDAAVEVIETVAGGEADTVYRRRPGGRWTAEDRRP